MSKNLTKRQQELLSFLKGYLAEHKIMPTTREIQEHFGFASQTAAMGHLKALERKKVIVRHTHKARAVVLMDPDMDDQDEPADTTPSRSIPIYGCIAAGMSQEASPEIEGSITLDLSRLGKPHTDTTFALRVRGESMINAAICDGDIVILEPKKPRPGDIVAALIDGETTLKRYAVSDGKPFLHAENDLYPDLMPVRELQIQGIVVALVRSL